MKHTGKAYDSAEQLSNEIDSPDLDVDENTVLILRNNGPVGGQVYARIRIFANSQKTT